MDGAEHQGPDDFSVAPFGDSFDALSDLMGSERVA